jgi:glycerol kinase
MGTTRPEPVEGLLTTVAWTVGGRTAYALEGSIFVTGAALQWLRDGLGVIAGAGEAGPLAESLADNGGLYFVPALTGLGSPWWDPGARGTVVGLTRGCGRAHLVRAAVEAMAYQTADVVAAMAAASSQPPAELRVDGGASVMGFLLQFQADLLGVPVRRAASAETTALGAALLAGLAELWRAGAEALPGTRPAAAYDGWRRAVERARA